MLCMPFVECFLYETSLLVLMVYVWSAFGDLCVHASGCGMFVGVIILGDFPFGPVLSVSIDVVGDVFCYLHDPLCLFIL